MNIRPVDFYQLNTPCYVYLPRELQEGVDLLKTSVKEYWENTICGYSFKTNSLPYLINEMKKQGFYAEVVSGDEYSLAVHVGFDKIIYNGPVKDRETFFQALSLGNIINLDGKRELLWLSEYLKEYGVHKGEPGNEDKRFSIGLRVNFDLESRCPGETSAADAGSRFGFSYEKGGFKDAMDMLGAMGVPLSGIHLHSSSKTRSLEVYRQLSKMAVELKNEYDLELSYVDIGGGFFGGMKGRPEFPDYLKVISEELSEGFDPRRTTLILEPGTSLASRCFEYITRVVDVKDTHAGRFVTVDGSRTDVDPLHTKSGYIYDVIPACRNTEDTAFIRGKEDTASGQGMEDTGPVRGIEVTAPGQDGFNQVICGYTCMENDRLMEISDKPPLKEGDVIRIHKAGGYTMCLTPLFIRYFPDVYREEDGRYIKIRDHWGPEEYIRKSSYESYE